MRNWLASTVAWPAIDTGDRRPDAAKAESRFAQPEACVGRERVAAQDTTKRAAHTAAAILTEPRRGRAGYLPR